MSAVESPLRGDANFFIPRGYQQRGIGTAGYFAQGVQESKDDGIPLPRNQVQFATDTPSPCRDAKQVDPGDVPRLQRDSVATITGPVLYRGSLATVTGPTSHSVTAIQNDDPFREDQDMYHLLPAFSPFNDYLDNKERVVKTPLALEKFDGHSGLDREGSPQGSTTVFSPFYPETGESKTRSLLPSLKTTATTASIWSMDAVPKQSPFSPVAAVSDMNSRLTGDKVENWRQQASPFVSNGTENKVNNTTSLESLWESPFKQTTHKVPSFRHAEYDSPSFVPNVLNAATISCSTVADDTYAPSSENRSANGDGFEENAMTGSDAMASVPLPPPPGLPMVGSVAGYSHDLLSIREIEEKMTLLREQSSGLAGDLIQQAAR